MGPVKLSVSFVSRDAPHHAPPARIASYYRRAMPSFPVAVASVDEFLAALRMERYADQFASLSVDQLRSLTDKQLRMLGIETVADRKRLLTASVILCIESANKERRTAANGIVAAPAAARAAAPASSAVHEGWDDGPSPPTSNASIELLDILSASQSHGAAACAAASTTEGAPEALIEQQRQRVSQLEAAIAAERSELVRLESEHRKSPDQSAAGKSSDSSTSTSTIPSAGRDIMKGMKDRPVVQSIEDAIRPRYMRRVAVSCAMLLLLLLACYTVIPRNKEVSRHTLLRMSLSTIVPIAFQAVFTAVLASFWPTDAGLQTGWGGRCAATLYGATTITWGTIARMTWPLAYLYPPSHPKQTLAHQIFVVTLLLTHVHCFIFAALGINTWAHVRFNLCLHANIPLLVLISMHVLEGGGLFRRPTHACYLPICLVANSLHEAWFFTAMYALGPSLLALLSSVEYRKEIARITGLAHVPVALSDLPAANVLTTLSSGKQTSDISSESRGKVTWKVPLVNERSRLRAQHEQIEAHEHVD